MGNRILVTHATRAGSTAEVAAAIAEALLCSLRRPVDQVLIA